MMNQGGYPTTITSTDTFDLVGSELLSEVYEDNTESYISIRSEYFYWWHYRNEEDMGVGGSLPGGKSLGSSSVSVPALSDYFYVRIGITGNTFYVKAGTIDNPTQYMNHTVSLTDDELIYFRSIRLQYSSGGGGDSGTMLLGSINPNLNASPTTVLNTPSNNVSLTTTTPTLAFTATDPEGDDVSYQVQLSTDNTFATTHTDALSAADVGFSGTDPYTSGTAVSYTLQTNLTAGGITYYWRVRAKDPSGSTSWGDWAAPRTMVTEALPPTVTSNTATSIQAYQASVSGNVTNANGATITERGFVYDTSSNPTTANSKKVVSGTTGAFSDTLTGLTDGTTYYFRAYAINAKGTSYSTNRQFTTLTVSVPSVTTNNASSITQNSATLSGNVTSANNGTITERGLVWGTSANPTTTNNKEIVAGTTGSYTKGITGLSSNTTYHVRAYAINEKGTAYGSDVSFKTNAVPPTVSTGTVGTLHLTTAEINGSDITANPDGVTIDEYGIVYGTSSNPTISNSHKTGSGSPFDVELTSLTGKTTYYARAYAKWTGNSTNYAYGSQVSFKTQDPPSATTTTTSSITTSSVNLSGNITDDNGATITERGFVYSTGPTPTTSDHKVVVAGTIGSYSSSATGLSSNTTYYWAAYAINANGITYGTIKSFATLPIAPTITTGTASGLAIDEITITGSGVTANPDSQTITEYGVAYGTSSNPTTSSKKVGSGGESSYTVTIDSLTENTTYYFRAYAIWSGGTIYGSNVSYSTQGRATITLDSPSDSAVVTALQPQLKFTGSDPELNTITYQLQLSTSSSFGTTLIDVLSAVDTGFSASSGSDPFNSTQQITYSISSDLTRGVTYYWRVRGKDASGANVWGEWATYSSFDVDTITASVVVSAVDGITFDEADVHGEVTDDGGSTVTERGVVYSTTQNPTTADNKNTAGTGTGTFTASLSGLSGSTVYYARGYAINSKGTSYSSQISFATLQTPNPPSVVTGTVTNLTDITAQVVGSEVTLDGTETVVERGVVFSDIETTPDIDDRKVIASSTGLGLYDVGITGLDPDTVYYIRAYAINSIGVGYGTVETFTTNEPFVPDIGDGYWGWSPDDSNANISRSQATPEHSSSDLYLSDLNLEDSEDYTLYYESSATDYGELSMVLQWYEGGVKTQQLISPGTPYTFTYDTDNIYWAIRLFVTGENSEVNNINATFNNMYLAKESEFSGYVPFMRKGITEIKLENNWILDNRREETIQNIFNVIKGQGWRSFDATTTGLGWLEVGDMVTITDEESSKPMIIWNSSMTIDGSISERLFTESPEKTETDYNKAGNVTKALKNTQISVDKNAQIIESIAYDMYEENGEINEKFSQVLQDIEGVKTTVQSAGGINLIKNSVMYAFDDSGNPDKWTRSETGTLTISSSPESMQNGGISGNTFTLIDETVTQENIIVQKDFDFIIEEQKQYYALTARVKKNTVGDAYIKLSNRNQSVQIDLPDQTEYFWETVSLEELLPLDGYYDIEIYSDKDAVLQVTDLMLSPGPNTRQWTQANGEAMNTSVSITDEGLYVRSTNFVNDYTKQTALGFEVHKHDSGGTRIFGFNGDETNVQKLKSEKQISMAPMRLVPIDYGDYQGWALTRTEGNE